MSETNFANRTMWTKDNLDVMRGMNDACVDFIYLDPPFNSDRYYEAPIGGIAEGAAFKDRWTLDDVKVEWHGLIAEEFPAMYEAIRAAGITHSKKMQGYLIWMAIRLLEMKRILKPTGSIMLHCDDSAGHYIKVLMDGVFGASRFVNDIGWRRTKGRSDGKKFGRVLDSILYYRMGDEFAWNTQYTPLSEEDKDKRYRYCDDRGSYMSSDLSAKGLSGGGYHYEFHGHYGPWRFPEERMKELENEDRIHFPQRKGGMPRLKRYLCDSKGRARESLIEDIGKVEDNAPENVGYPTQKPVELVRVLIASASNEGDMVFDPFHHSPLSRLSAR